MTDEKQWTDTRRRIQLAVTALALVLVAGSVGYYALGFSLIDAVYQTVTTVSHRRVPRGPPIRHRR